MPLGIGQRQTVFAISQFVGVGGATAMNDNVPNGLTPADLELKVWGDNALPEMERRMHEITQTYELMCRRVESAAAYGERDASIAAWARQRIDIPDELPFPRRVDHNAIKQYYTRYYNREIAKLDATRRAMLESLLLTMQSNFH